MKTTTDFITYAVQRATKCIHYISLEVTRGCANALNASWTVHRSGLALALAWLAFAFDGLEFRKASQEKK